MASNETPRPPRPERCPTSPRKPASPRRRRLRRRTDWQQKYSELEAAHTEVADAYLRAKAEAENTRRRAEEEMAKSRKFALESFAESLLPVKDSLEAAIAMPDAAREQVIEGVHATLRQLSAALERNKVVEINPASGDKFDPHQHQAISVVPASAESTQEPNTRRQRAAERLSDRRPGAAPGAGDGLGAEMTRRAPRP